MFVGDSKLADILPAKFTTSHFEDQTALAMYFEVNRLQKMVNYLEKMVESSEAKVNSSLIIGYRCCRLTN